MSTGRNLIRLGRTRYVEVLCAALLAGSSFTSASAQVPAATDSEVTARRIALEVAGAFSNDGFKLRDGTASGPVAPKQPLIVQVNLYGGNEYWFSAGGTEPVKKLAVSVFDETGKLVESEPFQQDGRAAAGFSPPTSGPYYVCIQEIEGEPAHVCLVYSYK